MAVLHDADHATLLDRLHDMLRRADVSDVEINAGVRLSDRGRHKAAAALGVGPEQIDVMLRTLSSTLRQADKDDTEAWLAEAEALRFSYEDDTMGNVTVRDTQTGQSQFVQGAPASTLLRKLTMQRDPVQQQALLAAAMALREAAKTSRDKPPFAAEMTRDGGSYNFPWTLDGAQGTGTVSFAGGSQLKLDLLSVRDQSGDEIQPTPDMEAALLDIARRFIKDV